MKDNCPSLEFACLSDTGRVRTLNEDSVAVDRDTGIAVLADGVGGNRGGDVASRMAVDIISKKLRDELGRLGNAESVSPLAERIVAGANAAIHEASRKQPAYNGMGTTLVLAVFRNDRATLLHVGDSRIYRLRNGQLQLLTRDDSLLNEQVALGLIAAKDAGNSHNRHLVTQALGASPEVSVHLREEDVRNGDIYLLCSDGLNDLVDERDIELIIDSLKTNLPLAARHLVQLANDNGGYDNVSVALVRARDAAPNKKGWLARLFSRLFA